MEEGQKSFENGASKCYVFDWNAHRKETQMLIDKANDNHDVLKNILETNREMSHILTEIKNGLLDAVLGKNIVPTEVAEKMISEQRKAYLSIIKTISWAFGAILIVVIGLKVALPHLFGAPL